MSFEKPEQRSIRAQETGNQLQEIVMKINGQDLEKAIRLMSPSEREKLYKAVEISKTTTSPLV